LHDSLSNLSIYIASAEEARRQPLLEPEEGSVVVKR
jgi:hypothetical protein